MARRWGEVDEKARMAALKRAGCLPDKMDARQRAQERDRDRMRLDEWITDGLSPADGLASEPETKPEPEPITELVPSDFQFSGWYGKTPDGWRYLSSAAWERIDDLAKEFSLEIIKWAESEKDLVDI